MLQIISAEMSVSKKKNIFITLLQYFSFTQKLEGLKVLNIFFAKKDFLYFLTIKNICYSTFCKICIFCYEFHSNPLPIYLRRNNFLSFVLSSLSPSPIKTTILSLTQKSGSLILVSCLALKYQTCKKEPVARKCSRLFPPKCPCQRKEYFYYPVAIFFIYTKTRRIQSPKYFFCQNDFFILLNFLKRLKIFVIQHFVKFAFFVMNFILILPLYT